jgi:DNA-binding CsgD family transcriptional regulator
MDMVCCAYLSIWLLRGPLMARSTANRAEAQFRQICCLGLGEAALPAIFSELRGIFPSLSSTFFFADVRGGFAGAYDPNGPDDPARTKLFFDVFLNKRDQEIAGHSFAAAMTQVGVHDLQTSTRLDERSFSRTDMYNLILRPMGHGPNYMRMTIRERGRGLGLIKVYRELSDKHFTQRDKQRLAGLGGFFAQALSTPPPINADLVDSGRVGQIIANFDGKLLYFSDAGRRLLLLASHTHDPPSSDFGPVLTLPPPIVRLCRNMARVVANDLDASVPAYHCRNLWGGFTFRGQWLSGEGLQSSGLVSITITHQEPKAVRLLRRVGEMPLSARESEVCMLLASGTSFEAIADRLGISKHTAIAHGRSIYGKLEVHSRAELQSKLLPN